MFPVCFRCAFGVALHGARADLLRFGHLAPSMRRAGTRVGLSGGPGWGGALEGAWALSWTRACAANASSRLIMRAGASSSGMKSALRAAVTVDGWPRYLGGGRREESCGWASGGRHDVLPLSIE